MTDKAQINPYSGNWLQILPVDLDSILSLKIGLVDLHNVSKIAFPNGRESNCAWDHEPLSRFVVNPNTHCLT
jgi:hypothetical protein